MRWGVGGVLDTEESVPREASEAFSTGNDTVVRKRAKPLARRSRAERRREIAAAILGLMAKYGLEGTTVARIAEKVGIAPQSLYTHFRNRHEMLMAAVDPIMEIVDEWITASPEPDVVERLKIMGRIHADTVSRGRFEGFVLPAFNYVTAPPASGLPKYFGERQLERIKMIAEVIEEGKKQGSIRQDVDSMRAAYRMMVFVWSEDIATMMGRDEYLNDGISLEILDVLIDDMAVRKTES
jgi:AcrR family transcriptional regulator